LGALQFAVLAKAADHYGAAVKVTLPVAVPGWVEFIGHTGLETSVPPATLKLYVQVRLLAEFGVTTT
jgi:hypothetical protein